MIKADEEEEANSNSRDGSSLKDVKYVDRRNLSKSTTIPNVSEIAKSQ